jgi:hypothetical protein
VCVSVDEIFKFDIPTSKDGSLQVFEEPGRLDSMDFVLLTESGLNKEFC